jgi:hypothetical protein
MAGEPDLKKIGEALIQKALDRDGPDNVTLVLARFGGSLPEATDEEVVKFVGYDPGRDPGEEPPKPAAPPAESGTDLKATVEAKVPDEILNMNGGPPSLAGAGAGAATADLPPVDLRPRTSLVTFVVLALIAAAAGGLFIKCERDEAARTDSRIQAP